MTLHGVPRLADGMIERARLVRRLDDAAPLVVAHAPAGYGKTVAMAQWATSTPRRGLWLRMREGFAEPAALVQHLAAHLADFQMLEADNPLVTAAESLLVSDPWILAERGLRRLGSFTLVIDEAEHLYDETIAGILRLIADLPDFAVRATTRRANLLTEPALGVAFEVRRLGISDFALSPAEAAMILGADAASPVVAEVMRNGAAPALARVAVLGALDGAESGVTWSVSAAVESFLRTQALAWDARFAAFLSSIALAEVTDIALAERLSGDEDAAGLLDRAETEGLGYWTVSAIGQPERALFVLSPVFRRILDSHARRGMSPARTAELDRVIARWHFAGDRPFEALRYAVQSEDWDLANDVVRQRWPDLLRSGAALRRMFRGVPLTTLRTKPLISMLLAIIANADGNHRLRALEYFALATYGAHTQRTKSRPADRVLLRMVESAAYRVSGRTDASVSAAIDGWEILRGMDIAERDRLDRNEPTICNHLGLSLYYGGRVDDALELFRRSLAVADAKGIQGGLQGLALRAGALAVAGDVPDAAATVAEADRRRWPEGWKQGYPGSFLQLARSVLALEEDDPDAAAAHLATLDPHRATIEHWALLEHVDVLIALMRGRSESALLQFERVVRQQRARHAVSGSMTAGLQHTRSLVDLARGDLAAASKAIARAPADPRRAVSQARIDLAAGDATAALRRLNQGAGLPGDARGRGDRLALTAAAVALGGAESDTARDALLRLRSALADRRLFLPLVLTPIRGLDAMLRVAAAHDVDGAFVADLARARARAVIGTRDPLPRLTDRELAVARQLVATTTVAEIAQQLRVSPNTVKSQLRGLYRKLGVNSRDEAVRVITAAGVVDEALPA